MADDVLVEKLFNFICGSGGFVELSVLLRRSSPLGSRKTKAEARNWLNNQTEFVLVKDVDGKVTGVRIDLKKKLCSQYVSKGSCRKRKGFCKRWHICKTFIEGKCDGFCGLSHDFLNEANGEMAWELGLEKYSGGALKNIVAWSLPQVCESYLKNECKSEKCPYIHVCSKAVQGSLCSCALSHNLTDSHNMRILKRYDLVPQSRAVNVDFVRCSILVLCEAESVVSQNSFNAGANGVAIETETARTVVASATSIGNDATGKAAAENAITGKTTTMATVSSNSHSINTITDQTATANALTRGTAAANVVISQTGTANAVTSKSATGNAVNSEIENATAVASKSEGTVATSNPKIGATTADSSKTTKATAATTNSDIPAKSRFNICGSASVLFDRLCKEFNCSVPLAVLQKRQVVPTNELKDFLTILEENKDKFLVVRNEGGNIQEITAFCPKLRLCLNFVSLNCECRKATCPDFHLCRKFITGTCKHGERCSRSHSFRNKRDNKTLQQLGLDGLTNEELRQLMLSSSPQVCIDYNKGKCTLGNGCSRVHICKNYVTNACTNEPRCPLDHKRALTNQHTNSLLDKYMFDSASRTNVLKAILVCEEQEKNCNPATKLAQTEEETGVRKKSSDADLKMKRGTSIDYSSSEHQVMSMRRRHSLPLEDETEESFSSIKSSEATWIPCFPSERQVFESLCTEYDCSASFAAIARRRDLFPHGEDSAESWFRRTKGSFLITESDKEMGKISRVEAFSKEARLCLDYITDRTCQKLSCQCLHVCKNHITDCCSSGTVCPMNHVFHNKRDKAFLSRTKLDLLTEEQLRKLVLLSTPQVCVEYNNGICPNGDSCRRIHICCSYLRKSCDYCSLDHKKALSTGHTQSVLQRLQFSNVSKSDALKTVLDDKRILSTEEKKKNCHIHQDKPDAFICSHFLVGLCGKGLRCTDHHCSLPYHWQYQVPNIDVWKSFGAKDNLALEKLYCDVNVESRVKFTPTEALDFSLQKSETLGQGYEIIIDLDDMFMFLRPRSSPGTFISQLRRLSTTPYETCPCDYVPTFWTWYWKENNVWCTFDKDRWGRNLESMIEQAYLDKLEQGKSREKFKFITPEHEYNLFFYSTGMYQENLKTGTRRQVRRRPGKFVCSEDVEDLKWKFGDSTEKEQVSRVSVESKYTPTHWSSMPPHALYLRAGLTQSSDEFEVVEHLFRRTMNDYVNIIQIDRIQNPFMMEKYCRKKENMAVAAKRTQETVDERRLFHGTSPDAVEAICKQNFDWRLHGKNATVYGQGSYFAKKASYSHAYAKRDPCGFQYIFLAKVLVGTYTTGHSSYRRPPPKRPSDPASDLYDSCVDKQSNPTIFVVFDTDQFYPEYLIMYTTATQTTSSTGHHALPQPATAASARPKITTSSQPASGKQRQLASSTYPVGKSSYQGGSAALSGYVSTSVNPRPKAQPLNTHSPVVSATSLSKAVLRNGNSSTLSANHPRRLLGASFNLPGSSTGSVSSSIAASWSHSLNRSNHPTSTTSSSGSVSRSHHTSTVTSTIASRGSTPSATASSQSAAAVKSDYYATGFDSGYVALPSTTSQTTAKNTSQSSRLNPTYASSTGSTRTADTSTTSSTSPRGSLTDTSENTFPQNKKKEKSLKCPIS